MPSPSNTLLKDAFAASSMSRTKLQSLSLAGADLWIDLGRRHAKQLSEVLSALPGVDDKEPGDREVILAKVRILLDLIDLRYELVSGTTDYSDPRDEIRAGARHATWAQILATQRKRSFHPAVQGAFDILINAYACAGYLCGKLNATKAELESGKVPLIDPVYLHMAMDSGNLPMALSFLRCGVDWSRVPIEPMELTGGDRRTVYIQVGDFEQLLATTVEPGDMLNLINDALRTRQAQHMHANIDAAAGSQEASGTPQSLGHRVSRRRV